MVRAAQVHSGLYCFVVIRTGPALEVWDDLLEDRDGLSYPPIEKVGQPEVHSDLCSVEIGGAEVDSGSWCVRMGVHTGAFDVWDDSLQLSDGLAKAPVLKIREAEVHLRYLGVRVIRAEDTVTNCRNHFPVPDPLFPVAEF